MLFRQTITIDHIAVQKCASRIGKMCNTIAENIVCLLSYFFLFLHSLAIKSNAQAQHNARILGFCLHHNRRKRSRSLANVRSKRRQIVTRLTTAIFQRFSRTHTHTLAQTCNLQLTKYTSALRSPLSSHCPHTRARSARQPAANQMQYRIIHLVEETHANTQLNYRPTIQKLWLRRYKC